MAVYQAPEGYHFDPQSGLYLKKLIVTDTDGIEYDHRIYFNDETGEYTQESFPLSGKAIGEVRNPKAMKRGTKIALISGVSLICIAFIAVLILSNKNGEAYYSEEDLDNLYEMYDLDTTPDFTMNMEEFDGYFDEGGIIR